MDAGSTLRPSVSFSAFEVASISLSVTSAAQPDVLRYDGLRNPATGKCEGVSSAVRIAAIPAFVTDLPPATRTAAR